VVTDAAPVYPGVLEELILSAWHHVEQYASPSHLSSSFHAMFGLPPSHPARAGGNRTAQVIIAGYAFMQNLRRGHDDLGLDTRRPRDWSRRSPNSPEPSDAHTRRFAVPAERIAHQSPLAVHPVIFLDAIVQHELLSR